MVNALIHGKRTYILSVALVSYMVNALIHGKRTYILSVLKRQRL